MVKYTKKGDLMFTKNDAIRICERRVPYKASFHVTCRECYYYDSRCELGFTKRPQDCYYYVNDAVNTNLVRKNILNNPDWVIGNWNMICDADKKLFFAIYGESVVHRKIRRVFGKKQCPECGAEMSKYPFYDECYEYYDCPNCDYVKRVKRFGVK